MFVMMTARLLLRLPVAVYVLYVKVLVFFAAKHAVQSLLGQIISCEASR